MKTTERSAVTEEPRTSKKKTSRTRPGIFHSSYSDEEAQRNSIDHVRSSMVTFISLSSKVMNSLLFFLSQVHCSFH